MSLDAATGADADAVGSWSEFLDELHRLAPALPHDVGPETRIGDLLGRDRILKGQVSAALGKLLFEPPEGLVTTTTVLREVFDWHRIRATSADAVPPQPGDRLEQALRHMRTANARLRPVRRSDVEGIYDSAIDPRWSYRWRYRGATPSIEDFTAHLHQGVLCQFVVESTSDRQPVGLVSCYGARPDLGWAYIAFTRIAPASTRLGSEMLEGGGLFISFLFRNWELRKLYAEVPGWNWELFESGVGEYFEVEGVLKQHEYFDGRFWDQRLVALHRDAWTRSSVELLGDLYATEEAIRLS